MSRAEGWELALSEYASARVDLPFVWGSNDCAKFPADFGVSIGCADFLDGLRDYDSAITAASTLQSVGYGDVWDLVEDRLTYCHPMRAQRGDVGVVENLGKTGIYRYSLVLFEREHIIGPGETMLWRGRRSLAIAAFRLE